MAITPLKKSTAEYKGQKLVDVFSAIEDYILDLKEREDLDLGVDVVVSGDVAYLSLDDIEPRNGETFECYFTFRNGVLITLINRSDTSVMIDADWVFEKTARDAALILLNMASVIGGTDSGIAVDF